MNFILIVTHFFFTILVQVTNGTMTLSEEQLLEFEKELNETLVIFAIPDAASLSTKPSYHNNEERSALVTQPAIQLVDIKGNWVQNVGGKGEPWEVTARLIINKGGDPEATLIGDTVAQFIDGTAQFVNLGISDNGTNYDIIFDLTKPENQSFSVTAFNLTASWVKEDSK